MKPLTIKDIIKKIKNSKTFHEYQLWKKTLSEYIELEREENKMIDDIIRINKEAERKEKAERFEEELKKERAKDLLNLLWRFKENG